jgi:hypothetical protein
MKSVLNIGGNIAGAGSLGDELGAMMPYLLRDYVNNTEFETVKLKEISTEMNGESRATIVYEETLIFANGREETAEQTMTVVRVGGVWYIDEHLTAPPPTPQPVNTANIPVNSEEDFGFRNVDGGVEITNYTGGAEVHIPAIIMGQPVVSIGSGIFWNGSQRFNNTVTTLIIPDSVKTIGNDAFRQSNSLTTVVIGNGVTHIGDGAFAVCNNLISLTMGNSVRSIGSEAFQSSMITSIVIPDSVVEIGASAFKNCRRLTDVTLGMGITSISDQMFYDCSSLATITLHNNITSIGESAFFANRLSRDVWGVGLTHIIIPDSVTHIGNRAFMGTALTSIVIPDSVVNFGEEVFLACRELENVVIGNGVTSIGRESFSGCSLLTSITLGNSVTSIGDRAFRECKELTTITIPDSVTEVHRDAFIFTSFTRITYRGTTYGNLADFLVVVG